MSNRKCVYCFTKLDKQNSTKDHVLPRSWHLKPDDSERWTVPSCVSCNSKYGKMEDEFKLLITMCMTPTADNIDYIKKTLSSVKAAEGKNEKDSWHRQAKLKKLVKNIMPAKKYEGKDFPNFGGTPRT